MKTLYQLARVPKLFFLLSIITFFSFSSHSQSGCTDITACNYDGPSIADGGVLTDDGSCCLGNCAEFIMTDSFGDGWNTGFFEVFSDGDLLISGTLENGDSLSLFSCIPEGCYYLHIDGGSYAGEMDLRIMNSFGDTLYDWNNNNPNSFADYGIVEDTHISFSNTCFDWCDDLPTCGDPLALNYNELGTSTDCLSCTSGSDTSCCLYPNANDECTGALTIQNGVGVAYDLAVDAPSGGASASGGSTCNLDVDLWYAYTALCNNTATINVSSAAHGGFAVYSGSCNALLEEGCYPTGTNNANIQTLEMEEGITYYFQVAVDPSNYFTSTSGTLTVTEGICEGCTDENYQNYNPNAVIDDGSCEVYIFDCAGDFNNSGTISSFDLAEFLSVFGTICDPLDPCYGDFNDNGSITSFDLAEFLSVFGTSCEE